MGDDFLNKIIEGKKIVSLVLSTEASDVSGSPIIEIIEGAVTSYSRIGLGLVDITGINLWIPICIIKRIIMKDNNEDL